MEEDASTLFPNNEFSIQNKDSYFPLAISNSWVYENWLATVDRNGPTINKINYTGKPIKTEHSVGKVNYYEKKTGEFTFDYGFSPLSLGSVIGGFFGNFQQIRKQNGNYIRKSAIKVESKDINGNPKTDYKYELGDHIFLSDNIVPDQLISLESGTIGEPGEGVYIEYETESKAVAIHKTMPQNMCNNPGIDDHLCAYTDVLHTRDIVRIKKLTSYSDGGIRLRFKGYADIVDIDKETGQIASQVEARSFGESELFGLLGIFGNITLIPVFAIAFLSGDLDTFPYNLFPPLKSDLKLGLKICPVRLNIDIDDVFEGSSTTLVSNQPLFYIDHYWVKGVGNIKSITSPAKFDAVINLNGSDDDISTEPTVAEALDPNCVLDNINTVQLKMQLFSRPNVGNASIGLSLETRSHVQNLKKHTIRKSIN
jgi:hypothetical protein